MATFSIVIPVYNEELYLESFFSRLKKETTGQSDFEFVFVDDGSTDFSARMLAKFASEHENVKIITLDKNYGKHIAIAAGFKHATGDAVTIFTIKKGEPFPALAPMINKWLKGADVVLGYKVGRNKGLLSFFRGIKFFFLRLVLKLMRIEGELFDKPDAELYDRKVVRVLNELPQKNVRLRRLACFSELKYEVIVFEPAPPREFEDEEVLRIKTEIAAARILEGARTPRKLKKRAYEASLWMALLSFLMFGMLLIVVSALYAFGFSQIIIYSLLTLEVFIFILTALFFTRSLLIKWLGFVVGKKKRDELYVVKSIIG